MEVYYAAIDLPTGRALAAATERGLARLELKPGPPGAWLERLEAEFEARPVKDERRLSPVRRELEAYFAGSLRRFTVRLDVHGTKFQEAVWRQLLKVRYGLVITYGGLAEAIGRKGAARAVGGALNANQVPIIIPCHRVVGSGGRLGGYGSGVDIKMRLLELEGVPPPYRSQ